VIDAADDDNVLQFAIIFLTAFGAYLGAPWWAAAACAGVLFATSPLRQGDFGAQLAAAHVGESIKANHMLSAAHAFVAGTAAYGLGLLVRLMLSA
jgi:hypothetical protein